LRHFILTIVVGAAINHLAMVRIAEANPLDTSDANYIQICLATTKAIYEQSCSKPTDAERAVVGAEDFFERDGRGALTDEELSKLGRWWAIAQASAKYCDGKNGDIATLDINLHTQFQLDALRKSSKIFAQDYAIGEKTATRIIKAAKVSALSELGTIESPSDTWYCSQPPEVLPIVYGEYAPPTHEQTAEIDALLAEWKADPTPAIANKDAILAITNDAPQEELYRLFGATMAMGVTKSPCIPDGVLNEWSEVERKFVDLGKLDSSLNELRSSGRDWSSENQFIIEQRIAARSKVAPMTPSEKTLIEQEYSLPENSNPGDWQTALNEIRTNAAYDDGKKASCVLLKREFSKTLVFAKASNQ
jgi:hypothetical protein